MSTPNPSLLIVHGAYFLPESYQPFIATLKSQLESFEVQCPRLPTCGDTRPPSATLSDDIAAVQHSARELQRAGRRIIVLAHSFGGVVASGAITPEFYGTDGSAGVVAIVYLCAHLPLSGESLGDIFAKFGMLCDVELDIGGDGMALVKNARETFFNDMPDERKEYHANRNVTHNLGLVGDAKVEHVPWRDVPSTYVYCKQDLAIKLKLQEDMVDDAKNYGGRFETVMLDAAHCPFLSMPEEVVKVIGRVWEKVK